MSKSLRKAIAIDFDGCLCNYALPEIGAPHWDIIGRAKKEQQKGASLIIWTCRERDLGVFVFKLISKALGKDKPKMNKLVFSE